MNAVGMLLFLLQLLVGFFWRTKALNIPFGDSRAVSIISRWDGDDHVRRYGTELRLHDKRWTASGANVYWLGLDENVIPPPGQPFYLPSNASYPTLDRITEVMSTVKAMGGTVVRSQTLGVSVGNPLSLMPSLGVFNEEAFKTIDWAVYQARQHGLRLLVPLTDNYDYYHGGKFSFLRFRGIDIDTSNASLISPLVQQFYTNVAIIQDFENYIQHLITHVNPYTGLSYGDDATIFAFETGNELGGPTFGDMDVPAKWIAQIAEFIFSLAPNKLIVDGTYGVNASHLEIPQVDIYSNHYYPPNNAKLQTDITLVKSANKAYLVGEYDWTGANPQANSFPSFLGIIEYQQTATQPVVVGDLFWSLFMHNLPNCNAYVQHNDSFTMHYGDPTNTPMQKTQINRVVEHFYHLARRPVDRTLPPPCFGRFEY